MSGDALIVQEVATRDGFQIEPVFVPTAEKIRLIDALAAAGFSRIEVSSFVSPKAVPALADAAEVFSGIRRRSGTVYVALVPNPKGAERALEVCDLMELVAHAAGLQPLAGLDVAAGAS